jgi:hypothetical protein
MDKYSITSSNEDLPDWAQKDENGNFPWKGRDFLLNINGGGWVHSCSTLCKADGVVLQHGPPHYFDNLKK